MPFKAKFAEQEVPATNFSEDPGSDGFLMNSAPLFEVCRRLNFDFPIIVVALFCTRHDIQMLRPYPDCRDLHQHLHQVILHQQ